MSGRLDDDERALTEALGGAPPAPRRSDDAFSRAVASEVRERRRRPFALVTSLWATAGAAAAALLFVSLTSPASGPASGDSSGALLAGSLAALAEAEPTSVDALDDATLEALADEDGYLALFDDDSELLPSYPTTTSALADEELLALHAALDEALSL